MLFSWSFTDYTDNLIFIQKSSCVFTSVSTHSSLFNRSLQPSAKAAMSALLSDCIRDTVAITSFAIASDTNVGCPFKRSTTFYESIQIVCVGKREENIHFETKRTEGKGRGRGTFFATPHAIRMSARHRSETSSNPALSAMISIRESDAGLCSDSKYSIKSSRWLQSSLLSPCLSASWTASAALKEKICFFPSPLVESLNLVECTRRRIF